jgi:hypothetical protein
MEPDQERIARLVRQTGATEEEALVIFHLQSMARAWNELPPDLASRATEGGGGARTRAALLFTNHYQPLMDMMLARITRREHPEGWGGGAS